MSKSKSKSHHDEADEDAQAATSADVENVDGEPKAPGDGTGDGDGQGDGEEREPPTLEEQMLEMKDRWLRSKAETDNVRRRARLDVEEARRFGAASLIQSLLPVLDSLQMALGSKPEDSHDQVWEGLALTEQMFMGALAANGLTPLEAKAGDDFDPSAHKAVLEHPTDEHEPGKIVMELVRGYRLHDRLLREAQVTVAKSPADGASPGGPSAKDEPDADV